MSWNENKIYIERGGGYFFATFFFCRKKDKYGDSRKKDIFIVWELFLFIWNISKHYF